MQSYSQQRGSRDSRCSVNLANCRAEGKKPDTGITYGTGLWEASRIGKSVDLESGCLELGGKGG